MVPAATPIPVITWIEIFGLVSNIASLILSVLAIWLSLYFFVKAKNTEQATHGSLESIKSQTDALQKLTGRWMDRLTRYATEPRPADGTLVILTQALRDMPANLASLIRPPASQGPAAAADPQQTANAGIVLYSTSGCLT